MNDVRKRIEETLKQIEQERDELRVKLNLAKMEAGDEWHEIEDKLAKLEAKAKEVRHTSAEVAKDIGAAALLLAEEIRDGFKAIARRL